MPDNNIPAETIAIRNRCRKKRWFGLFIVKTSIKILLLVLYSEKCTRTKDAINREPDQITAKELLAFDEGVWHTGTPLKVITFF